MKINKEMLKELATKYTGYLEGEKLVQFFQEIDIKFAAGHWAAGGFGDRFTALGGAEYNPDLDSSITAQIARVAEAGIQGIECHEAFFLNEKRKKDKDKIVEVKKVLDEFKVTPTNMNINLYSDSKWQHGGITNPDKSIRAEALSIALQAIEIAREIGCESVALWPGSDGWDYNFEVHYGQQLDYLFEGCTAINNTAKSVLPFID